MATPSDLEQKRRQLAELRDQVRLLESEILESEAGHRWEPTRFYWTYHATTGAMLGAFAAIISLLFNVVCAPMAGRHPLEIIRVYLTFPLGERALELTSGAEGTYVISDGVVLAVGCCLYLGTGLLLGAVFQIVMQLTVPRAPLSTRLMVATVLGTLLWAINFYGILVWLQPALFGGNWITDSSILPWWVALATHIIFGWTMALVQPLGAFTPRGQAATAT